MLKFLSTSALLITCCLGTISQAAVWTGATSDDANDGTNNWDVGATTFDVDNGTPSAAQEDLFHWDPTAINQILIDSNNDRINLFDGVTHHNFTLSDGTITITQNGTLSGPGRGGIIGGHLHIYNQGILTSPGGGTRVRLGQRILNGGTNVTVGFGGQISFNGNERFIARDFVRIENGATVTAGRILSENAGGSPVVRTTVFEGATVTLSDANPLGQGGASDSILVPRYRSSITFTGISDPATLVNYFVSLANNPGGNGGLALADGTIFNDDGSGDSLEDQLRRFGGGFLIIDNGPSVTLYAAPEPGTLALLGLGAATAGAGLRRRKKKAKV